MTQELLVSLHMNKPFIHSQITKNWNYTIRFFVIFPGVRSGILKAHISELTNGSTQEKNPSCVLGKIVGGVSDDRMNSSVTIEDILEKSHTYVRYVEDLLVVRTTDRLTLRKYTL